MKLFLTLALSIAAATAAPAVAQSLPPEPVTAPVTYDAQLAALSLACVQREYPNKPGERLGADTDLIPPRTQHPVFYGCFDWHSAVHSHWMLVRLLMENPNAPYAASARAVLNSQFAPERIAGEVAYFQDPGHADFERPYGQAWFLTLMTELRGWNDPDAMRWRTALAPLEAAMVANLSAWLPHLAYANRSGTHGGTALPFAMMYDWARTAPDPAFAAVLRERILALYGQDRACPIGYEPSASDFVSPCLAEADLMRRVMTPDAFASWLAKFLPDIPKKAEAAALWLTPAVSPDRSDPWFVHLDGLNISRAWALAGIARGLPANDRRRAALAAAARIHADAGISALAFQSYEGNHWLGSFLMYLQRQTGPESRRFGGAQ